jgi:two-component system response regulator FixJ
MPQAGVDSQSLATEMGIAPDVTAETSVKPMSSAPPTVFIVDDDPGVCKLWRLLIESAGFAVKTYTTATDFLADYDPHQPGCLVLDVQLPDVSGLEVQRKLSTELAGLPIIFVSGYGNVPLAVSAMREGAVDFLEKPISARLLLDRVREAIETDRTTREQRDEKLRATDLMKRLTPRETQVMELVASGRTNKEIASSLTLSTKTVEVHRARIMEKLRVKSVADLVRLRVASGDGKV